jgi:uncharacterized membrane protein YhaH (DUF805 family)
MRIGFPLFIRATISPDITAMGDTNKNCSAKIMIQILSPYGRASRADWWIATIIGGIIVQVAFVIALIAGLQEKGTNWTVFVLCIISAIIAIWWMIVVTARRFRDRGDSPWMTLLFLVPVLGEIWILIVCGLLPNPGQGRRRLVVKTVSNGKDITQAEQASSSNGG